MESGEIRISGYSVMVSAGVSKTFGLSSNLSAPASKKGIYMISIFLFIMIGVALKMGIAYWSVVVLYGVVMILEAVFKVYKDINS